MNDQVKQIARDILDAIVLEAANEDELFARYVPMFGGAIVVIERIPLIDTELLWPKPEPWPCYSCAIPVNTLAKGTISVTGKHTDTNRKVANLLRGIAEQYHLQLTFE